MENFRSIALALGVALPALSGLCAQPVMAENKVEISKCKDAEGKWHYGDTAAEECARSKITVIDKRGIKVEELRAPPTAEDLKRQEVEAAAAAEAAVKAEEEKRKRDRIKAIYDSEDAILRARDERVSHVDRQIATYQDMAGRLRQRLDKARSQGAKPEAIQQLEADLAAYERAIVTSEQQHAEIMERYAQDLAEYRAMNPPSR